MQDLPALFPAFLATLVSAAATAGSGKLTAGKGHSRAALLRYTSLMVPATAGAFALAHLHSDYGTHVLPCLPLILLGAMTILAGSFAAGALWRQWRLQTRLRCWCIPLSAPVRATVVTLAARLGLTTPAVHLVAVDLPIALTVGILKPRIYLSEWYLRSLSAAELEGVLAHELAHIARRDNLFGFLGTAFLGATAYLPVSWRTARLLLQERELAADELAVAITGRPLALARGLVKASTAGTLAFGVGASSLGGALDERLLNLLHLSKPTPLDSKRLRTEPQRLAIATLLVPLVLGWLIFSLPHLLMLP